MAKVDASPDGPPVTVVVASAADGSSPGVVGGGRVVLAPQPSCVADLPLYIQRGFIRKTLALLLLQQLFMLGAAALLRFALPGEGIGLIFPANSTGKVVSLGLGVIVFGTIPLLAYVRDRHPWNMVATIAWTLTFSLFMAGAHADGGLVRSYFFFVIFSCTAAGIAVMLVLCTTFTCPDAAGRGRVLFSPVAAGCVGWVLMLVGAIVFYTQDSSPFYSLANYIGAVVVASVLLLWIAYDMAKLCEKMQPDDYMKGVTYFYTDFLTFCCCCLATACVSTAIS